MSKMTITEALAEIKLIEKKAEKKRQTVGANLVRYEHVKDPFESDGGSKVAMKREVQSIGDLENQLVKIRSAIAKANIETTLTVGEQTKSVYDWLTWKREVSEKQVQFFKHVYENIKHQIDKQATNPQVFKTEEGQVQVAKLSYNLEYADFLSASQKLSDTLETLDGKLSLKNATVMVDV